ncbi:MAG: hypothetical protein ACOY94_07575 [Bacillota bacterium]
MDLLIPVLAAAGFYLVLLSLDKMISKQKWIPTGIAASVSLGALVYILFLAFISEQ